MIGSTFSKKIISSLFTNASNHASSNINKIRCRNLICSASSCLNLKEIDKPTQFNVFTSRSNNFSTSFKSLNENAANTPAPTQTPSAANKQELFYVEERTEQGYAIFRLNKRPVNSLNLEFLTALNIQLDKFEQTKNIQGIILTSNMPNIFSAGLDIMEMYNPKPDRLRQFWSALQEFWIKLYGSNKIYIAAINGHSPAGGCLMAMSCDYRIMAKGVYKIGLNETLLGIKAPFWFRDTMINTIGFRESEKALQLGKLYSAEEALAINLVDEIVESEYLLANAEEQMLKWIRIPAIARELTKSSMRRDIVSKLLAQRESDIENFVEFTTKDFIQKSLKSYLETLKKPKKSV